MKTTEEMIKAVQEGRVLYGVSNKNYRIYRCKLDYIKFEHGKQEIDSAITLVGKRKPKTVGKLTLFTTRKEAREWAAEQMFRQLVEREGAKVIDAKCYVIELQDGTQWRPVKDSQEVMCLSFDQVRVCHISTLPGMVFCPADYTTQFMPGDKLTYKWTAPCDK